MSVRQRISELRERMKQHKLDAYLVPSSDPHQSEYLPANWKRREFITGFTGSAGDAVITRSDAVLWTDSRYFIQAKRELRGSGIRLMKLGVKGTPSIPEWLGSSLRKGSRIGCDPHLHSHGQYLIIDKQIADAGMKLVGVRTNLVDPVWEDQPEPSTRSIEVHPVRYAGESVASKLRRVRAAMKTEGATVHVVTALDAIAWLFNIRGTDINYNPLAIAYATVTERGATLFTDPRKVTPELRRALGKHVRIRRYDSIRPALWGLGSRTTAWIDPTSTSQWIVACFPKTVRMIHKPSPIVLMRARKNAVEIKGAARAHVRDGVAMVRFLHWLEQNVASGKFDEISAASKLEEFRGRSRLYRGPSFDPIIGYGENAAMVHYSAKPGTCATLRARGQVLMDTGGQYLDGTTDITRTVALSRPTSEQKELFTLVLKGHIAIATAVFPAGTTGFQIDALARQPLWRKGINYGHGTGHGVGSYLCVHEGPHRISPLPNTIALEPGMVMSNEPGAYEEGKFGVRIENLIYVTRDPERSSNGAEYRRFENLTLCPIDLRLIDQRLLTADEVRYLNDYHATVRRKLTRFLSREDARWLRNATRAI